MKAFFHRLHIKGGKDKDRDNNQHRKETDKFPPLPSWPPQPATADLAFTPLPVIVRHPEISPEPESTATVPPPKVTRPSYSDGTHTVVKQAPRTSRQTNAPTSITGAIDVQKVASPPLNLGQSLPSEISNPGTFPKTTASRLAYSPPSNTSGILAATSWSEVTENDLVSNIGSRERTRQEVLFEIILSEERYFQELVKMKDTFIDPLLHPYSTLAFKNNHLTPGDVLGNTITLHQLPDLRICLEMIDSAVFDGHKRLSEALKKRYDDQYPLVRSLADVFISNSGIFAGYTTYIVHLERALEQVDAALSNASAKKQDIGEWQRVCKVLRQLEETAAERGETGLAITLSKPFQRLLKYPLLFQNLLYHTDPSTFEYESTLLMVAEVENIVRSIEDEKIQKEERDKTRDVFARIEGLDNSRCQNHPASYSRNELAAISTEQANYHLLRPPEVLRFGGKTDLWLVVFNDVALRCQRTGITSLPISSTTASRTTTTKRNLYKFIKIETWDIADVAHPQQGVVSMEDVAKSRPQPRMVTTPNEERHDDDDEKSKMSFSYWGADRITLVKPRLTPRITPRPGVITASYGRESSANAKFGARLVQSHSPRRIRAPIKRIRAPTEPKVVPMPNNDELDGDESDESDMKSKMSHSFYSCVSQPTRAPLPPPATLNDPVASPTPSEESGVGLYRQMLAKDVTRPTATISRPAWAAKTRSPPEDSGVGMYGQILAKDLARPTATIDRPAWDAKTHSPPSEDSGIGIYRQMIAKDLALNSSA